MWSKIEITDEKSIKARAGHTMTLVGDKLYVMGGSYGQNYIKDFIVIDTGNLIDL